MMKITFNPGTHQYFDREGKELPSVTYLLQHFGLINFEGVNPRALEAGRKFGRVVHDTTALYDRNDLKSYDPAIEAYLAGWIKFKTAFGLKAFDLIEKPLGSKIWRFAGTLDRFKKSLGLLLDLKTGVEQPATDIQLAGYEILIGENFPGTRVRDRLTVKLFPNNFKIIEHKERIDSSLIKSAAQLYGWKQQKGLVKCKIQL